MTAPRVPCFPFAGTRRRTRLAALLFLVTLAPPTARADEWDVVDPLVRNQEVVLSTTLSGGISVALVEGWRQYALALVDLSRTSERENRLEAITIHALLQVDKAIHVTTARAEVLLDKLRKDMRIYEIRFPNFERADYRPTDEDEARYFKKYNKIKTALRENEAPVRATAKAALAAVEALRVRAGKGKFLLVSLETPGGFLATKVSEYHRALGKLENEATELADGGASPRKQPRIIFNNKTPNLVFFVQIAQRDRDGNFTIRKDTQYPVPLYPDAKPDQQFVNPKGPRGPKRLWYPINAGDKLIVRVATMGPIRDRIRFLPIKGASTYPDLNTLERGFYYMGYETKLPTQVAPLVARWYPVEETYRWNLRGAWAPGEPLPPVTKSTDGKTLRGFGPALSMSNDFIEWNLPAGEGGLRSIMESERSQPWAEVTGTTTYQRIGPKSTTPNPPESETGSGELRVILEWW